MNKIIKHKYLYLILFLVFILTFHFIRTFNIDNPDETLTAISKFLNKSTSVKKIELITSIKLDNKNYILVNNDKSLFFIESEASLFNRYKIKTAIYNFENLRSEVIKTNNNKYFIIYGKLDNPEINYATIEIMNSSYKINFNNHPYVISYSEVSPYTPIGITMAKCKFYNKDGNLISDKNFK